MLLSNYTPFAPFVFESEDVDRREFFVVVLRGSFAIVDGEPLQALPDQDPVVLADRYRGALGRSSLLLESDLAPYKPRSDIQIEALACAPNGEAAASWPVAVRVGRLHKELRVTGPRSFRRVRGRWELGPPSECLRVPVTYEMAFGGRQRVDEVEYVCHENPVGLGWVRLVDGEIETPLDEIAAPQVESMQAPVVELGVSYVPEGLGPVARAWQPRLGRAGRFDEGWRRERWPALPRDFDFAHYNSAHRDLIYPGYLRGDEVVWTEGLDAAGRRSFSLPGVLVGADVRDGAGRETSVVCELDTLRIDLPAGRAHLSWRGRLYDAGAVRQVVTWLDELPSKPTAAGEGDG